jgi:hypothetical protein
MRLTLLAVIGLVALGLVASLGAASAQYYGNYSANPNLPRAPAQPRGTFTNPYGNDSNSPRLYGQDGGFAGNLNANRYDPNSVANPYGRYGSPYSSDSTNNPYGRYGSPYAPGSATNPYGNGLGVYGPNR